MFYASTDPPNHMTMVSCNSHSVTVEYNLEIFLLFCIGLNVQDKILPRGITIALTRHNCLVHIRLIFAFSLVSCIP